MYSLINISVVAAICFTACTRAATVTTTTSTTAAPQICAQAAFLQQTINGKQYCCAGSLDQDKDNGQAYCCVGNNNGLATNTATNYESDRTGTIAMCSTTIHVTESGYTSKVEAAGTKYGVSYVSPVFFHGTSTSYMAVTPTSTGAAIAAKTPMFVAGEALLVFGAVALGI